MAACSGTQITDTPTQESAIVTFRQLGIGKSTTISGLTYTALTVRMNTQVAAAFAGLNDGATPTSDANGTYSGALSGWSSGAVFGTNNNRVTFASTAPGNVTDITTNTTATVLAVTTTQGYSETLASILTGNTVCVGSPGSWQAQEYHQNGGDLIDWKQGAGDSVDPTSSVGSWNLTAGTGTASRVRYTYGSNPGINYRVFDHSDGTYSFCNGTTENAVVTKILAGQQGC
jgi:LysM repeat protein